MLPSRRKCLSCLCTTLGLITLSGPSITTPKGLAMDMRDGSSGIEKPGCRNCGGSGAIICKESSLSSSFHIHGCFRNFLH